MIGPRCMVEEVARGSARSAPHGATLTLFIFTQLGFSRTVLWCCVVSARSAFKGGEWDG